MLLQASQIRSGSYNARMIKALPLAVLSLFLLATPAHADEAKKIGTYGDWTAYTFQENGAKACYMAATPRELKGNYTKRGNVYAMITHRPAEKSRDVFSFLAGYAYKTGAKVTLSVDGQPFMLVGNNETAWTPSADTDAKLVAALRKGSKFTVEGSSERGTATKDTFSLKGSGSAYDVISKECKVN